MFFIVLFSGQKVKRYKPLTGQIRLGGTHRVHAACAQKPPAISPAAGGSKLSIPIWQKSRALGTASLHVLAIVINHNLVQLLVAGADQGIIPLLVLLQLEHHTLILAIG